MDNMDAVLPVDSSTDADNYVNDPAIEMAWAIKAAEAASIHMNLLLAVEDTRQLKLNKMQEEIHAKFREKFPDLSVERVSQQLSLVHSQSASFRSQWRISRDSR